MYNSSLTHSAMKMSGDNVLENESGHAAIARLEIDLSLKSYSGSWAGYKSA